eukprot:scaffold10078_cov70-Cyclotella_meneghiniana.AAC.2
MRQRFVAIFGVLASQLWRLLRVRVFFDSDVRITASKKMEKKRAAAALPGARMLTLGPGGVAAAGGWSIALLFSRYWPPW